MTPKRLWIVMLAVVLVAGIACKPKPPEPPQQEVEAPEPPPPPPEPVREVEPPPKPPVQDKEWYEDAQLRAVTDEAYRRGLLGSVHFAFDEHTLDDKAKAQLQKNVQFFRERAEFVVTIEGHCDERGTNEYNLALGERRSNAAKDYLVSLGVPASRFRTISYGEERGVCSASNEDCWWQNRRAYFNLTGRQ